MPNKREPFRGLGLVSLGVAFTFYSFIDGVPWFALVAAAMVAFGLLDWARMRQNR